LKHRFEAVVDLGAVIVCAEVCFPVAMKNRFRFKAVVDLLA
jgi:hypothetical protein